VRDELIVATAFFGILLIMVPSVVIELLLRAVASWVLARARGGRAGRRRRPGGHVLPHHPAAARTHARDGHDSDLPVGMPTCAGTLGGREIEDRLAARLLLTAVFSRNDEITIGVIRVPPTRSARQPSI